jgi:hypothetical protein
VTAVLILGALLAFCVLSVVLLPLVRPRATPLSYDTPAVGAGVSADQAKASGETKASAIEILREIEFDRATGKLSDADYGSLKSSYTGAALAELRAADAPVPMAPSIAGNSPVCPVCGPRPEADARYCSSCAQYIPGVCATCGAGVTQPAARFCTGCGANLAA